MKADSWNGFVEAFGEAVARQTEHAGDQLTQSVDGVLELGAMHAGLAERLQKFEPVGQGNAAATWLIQNVHIAENRPLKGGVVRLKVSDGAQWLDAIVFGGGALAMRWSAEPLFHCLVSSNSMSIAAMAQYSLW